MDELIVWFNLGTSAFLAAASAWAILSHRVRDGVIIKTGLILACFGFGATAWHLANGINCADLLPLNRCLALVQVGCLLVTFGYGLHVWAGRSIEDIIDFRRDRL